jgi:hypothetical protein
MVSVFFLSRFRYTSDGANDEIGLQAVFLLDCAVAQVLELDLVGGTVLLRNAEDVVAGFSEPPESLQQNLGLFFIGLEFALYGLYELHSHVIHHSGGGVNPRLGLFEKWVL